MIHNVTLLVGLSVLNFVIPITTVQAKEEVQTNIVVEVKTLENSRKFGDFSYYTNYSLPKIKEEKAKEEERIKQEIAEKARIALLAKQRAEEIELEKQRQAALEAEKARIALLAKKKASQRPASIPVKAPVATSNVVGSDFVTAIRNKCAQFGCNADQLVRVMYCESGGRSNAVNGVHVGLFQFNPKTFVANAPRSGLAGGNVHNPYDQIHVAAWMFANGQAWQWSCK